MIKRIGISIIMVVLLITARSVAQSTVTTRIKTQIYCSHCAQCETCGMRFDSELYKLKGLKSFSIDASANIITVSYNPKKINIDRIRQCISECGYDADDVPATEKGLSSLDSCCRKQE